MLKPTMPLAAVIFLRFGSFFEPQVSEQPLKAATVVKFGNSWILSDITIGGKGSKSPNPDYHRTRQLGKTRDVVYVP